MYQTTDTETAYTAKMISDMKDRIIKLENMVDMMAAENRLLQSKLDAANQGYIKIVHNVVLREELM